MVLDLVSVFLAHVLPEAIVFSAQDVETYNIISRQYASSLGAATGPDFQYASRGTDLWVNVGLVGCMIDWHRTEANIFLAEYSVKRAATEASAFPNLLEQANSIGKYILQTVLSSHILIFCSGLWRPFGRAPQGRCNQRWHSIRVPHLGLSALVSKGWVQGLDWSGVRSVGRAALARSARCQSGVRPQPGPPAQGWGRPRPGFSATYCRVGACWQF